MEGPGAQKTVLSSVSYDQPCTTQAYTASRARGDVNKAKHVSDMERWHGVGQGHWKPGWEWVKAGSWWGIREVRRGEELGPCPRLGRPGEAGVWSSLP